MCPDEQIFTCYVDGVEVDRIEIPNDGKWHHVYAPHAEAWMRKDVETKPAPDGGAWARKSTE